MSSIERVTPVEIYLVDKHGSRLKRICGDYSGGRVCTRDAGYKTPNYGQGPCWLHNNGEGGALVRFFKRGEGTPNAAVLRYLNHWEELSLEAADDFRIDMGVLYSLLGTLQEKGTLRNEDMDLMRRIIADITKVKEASRKAESAAKVDVKALKELVDKVFSVIVDNLDAGTSRRILTQIVEKVVLPLDVGALSTELKEVHSTVDSHRRILDRKLQPSKKNPISK